MNVVEFGNPGSALTIVVPTADIHGKWFPRCVESIRRFNTLDVHVVGVESSGSEFNFSRSVNAGITLASKDVLILNDDTLLGSKTLEALVEARAANGEGVYQAYVHCLDGSPHDIGWSYQDGIVPFLKTAAATLRYAAPGPARRAALRAIAMTNIYPFHYHRVPTDGFDGFSFNATLVSGGTLRRLGPLDEIFRLGYDDVDYSLRCHIHGIPYFGVPRAVVYHAVNGTRAPGDERELQSYQGLRRKWPRMSMLKILEMGPTGRLVA